jgi:hypothetical protein
MSHYEMNVDGSVSGQAVVGDGNNIVAGASTLDVTQLKRFAEAAAQALPVLELGDDRRRAAEEASAQILAADEGADHGRLRALGRTLRTVLEETAGNVLAQAVLGMWSP